eukprot:327167-Hanusia_phi.AAC.1
MNSWIRSCANTPVRWYQVCMLNVGSHEGAAPPREGKESRSRAEATRRLVRLSPRLTTKLVRYPSTASEGCPCSASIKLHACLSFSGEIVAVHSRDPRVIPLLFPGFDLSAYTHTMTAKSLPHS